jgi:hypothetical protein
MWQGGFAVLVPAIFRDDKIDADILWRLMGDDLAEGSRRAGSNDKAATSTLS